MAEVRLIDVDKAAAELENLPRCVWRERLNAGEFDAPAAEGATGEQFKVGDSVRKTGGDYRFDGIVAAAFRKLSGAWRYVVEDNRGILHVYSGKNLKLRDNSASDPAPPPAEATTIPAAIPASVAPFLRAYIRETKRPDCLPEYRFEVTLPRGQTVWRSNLTDAVAAILDAVNVEQSQETA